MPDYIPATDPEFIDWQQRFVAYLDQHPDCIGTDPDNKRYFDEVKAAQGAWTAATSPNMKDARDRYVAKLRVLVGRLHDSPRVSDLARSELGITVAGGDQDGAIAKYESYDEWSRHFSNVRMTVVPFGITTAIAILAWGRG